MANVAIAGTSVYLQFGLETTFASESASINKLFGAGQSISLTRNNNLEVLYGLGARNASQLVHKKYEGSASMDFKLSEAWWPYLVLGKKGQAGVGPYTHTYEENNTIPSFTVEVGCDMTTDSVFKLLGCKVKSATFSSSVGEIASVRLDVPYANETEGTSLDGTPTAYADEALTFAHGTLQLPSGSNIATVQSVELTIDNDLEILWGLGSRFATQAVEKKRAYTCRATVTYEASSQLLELFYGGATGPVAGGPTNNATLILTFTNGGATTAERSYTMTFANCKINRDDQSFVVDSLVTEDVEILIRSCTSIVCVNNTAFPA